MWDSRFNLTTDYTENTDAESNEEREQENAGRMLIRVHPWNPCPKMFSSASRAVAFAVLEF